MAKKTWGLVLPDPDGADLEGWLVRIEEGPLSLPLHPQSFDWRTAGKRNPREGDTIIVYLNDSGDEIVEASFPKSKGMWGNNTEEFFCKNCLAMTTHIQVRRVRTEVDTWYDGLDDKHSSVREVQRGGWCTVCKKYPDGRDA
ncbi:MAG: hypothetical protein AAB443_02685 [Patescibacteria group bacterium]